MLASLSCARAKIISDIAHSFDPTETAELPDVEND